MAERPIDDKSPTKPLPPEALPENQSVKADESCGGGKPVGLYDFRQQGVSWTFLAATCDSCGRPVLHKPMLKAWEHWPGGPPVK